ncbi:hypothetical protein [Agrococcus baldri]|uniref:hypothetical protein n=1 Tax=Agrococcus baldri TaxID=153730 RepID=UPI001649EEAB|nr:hypothetical protein [Agrococcus baldri]
MEDFLDELDQRCPECNVLIYDERCRGCGHIIEAKVLHVQKPDFDDLPSIGGW